MPIRAEMKDLYPPDWDSLSLFIRFDRAGGRCECTGWCGAVPHEEGRCGALHGQPHPLTGSKVVLTTAHLDRNPANCDPANLAACCQRCHLAYDAEEHRRQASHTRAVRAAGDAPPLFPGLEAGPGSDVTRTVVDHTPQLKQIEIDTLRLVARGWSNKAIARAQNAAVDTVKSRINRLHKLLGTVTAPGERDILSRVLLVVWAYEHGLVEGRPSVSPELRDAFIGFCRSAVNDEPRGDLRHWAKQGLRILGVDQPNRNRYKPTA